MLLIGLTIKIRSWSDLIQIFPTCGRADETGNEAINIKLAQRERRRGTEARAHHEIGSCGGQKWISQIADRGDAGASSVCQIRADAKVKVTPGKDLKGTWSGDLNVSWQIALTD